jgi:hypothetical protein
MSFRVLLSALAVAGAATLPVSAAATSGPVQLLQVSAHTGHVRVVARLSPDVTASEVEVSSARRLVGTGFLPKSLVFRESITARPDSSGTLQFSTRHRLHPGKYWVAVSAIPLGEATSCMPVRFKGNACLETWSNVLPLRVR